jgi:hypothetical protein
MKMDEKRQPIRLNDDSSEHMYENIAPIPGPSALYKKTISSGTSPRAENGKPLSLYPRHYCTVTVA